MINGEGGDKAPELNYPTSVVEYIKPEYLTRWIENPSSIRHNTLMPGLAQEIPNRANVTKEIIAYLKAMSTTKRSPKRPRHPLSASLMLWNERSKPRVERVFYSADLVVEHDRTFLKLY